MPSCLGNGKRTDTEVNQMEKIESFTINHMVLEPGIYVSRKDNIGKEVVTTFDLIFWTNGMQNWILPNSCR